MISTLASAPDSTTNSHVDRGDDARLTKEIATLPGPLKAKLVMDYLGMKSDVGGLDIPELSEVVVPKSKAHDFRLIEGLLSELASNFEERPSATQRPQNKVISRVEFPNNKSSAPRENLTSPSAPLLENPSPLVPPLSCEYADLRSEHPRVAALILSTLDTKRTTKVLRKLDYKTSRRLALGLIGIENDTTQIPANVMDTIISNAR